MRCGKLRSFGNIETYTKTGTGDRGKDKFSWTTLYASMPMAIEELSGHQLFLAHQQCATASHKITVRYATGITPMTTRVNYGGRLLKIEAVNEGDMRQLWLVLLASEEKVGQ